MNPRWSSKAWLLAAAMLAGCSAVPIASTRGGPDIGTSPWAVESAGPATLASLQMTGWRHLTFPGKTPTKFSYMRQDGREAVAVTAASSASMLRSKVRVEPAELGSVKFSWKVPQLIAGADIASREDDDSPVRVVLIFEGDRSRFSARDAMLSELVHTLTGEPMPYATLVYAW
jgi:hypothetical protein